MRGRHRSSLVGWCSSLSPLLKHGVCQLISFLCHGAMPVHVAIPCPWPVSSVVCQQPLHRLGCEIVSQCHASIVKTIHWLPCLFANLAERKRWPAVMFGGLSF